MLSQYLLFTVIKEWLVHTSVSARVLKAHGAGKHGEQCACWRVFGAHRGGWSAGLCARALSDQPTCWPALCRELLLCRSPVPFSLASQGSRSIGVRGALGAGPAVGTAALRPPRGHGSSTCSCARGTTALRTLPANPRAETAAPTNPLLPVSPGPRRPALCSSWPLLSGAAFCTRRGIAGCRAGAAFVLSVSTSVPPRPSGTESVKLSG